MLELEDALQRILAAIPPPQAEHLALADVAGRVLLEKIVSPVDLPPFDNSSMDGYAVRAADVFKANTESPISLKSRGRSAAGESFAGELSAGECLRVFTGSVIPRGTDAVVMQEDTRPDSGDANKVLICDSVKPGENVRHRGEDIANGQTLADAGELLTPGKIALLAAVGTSNVSVGRQPVVGLLATGSELREAGQSLAPGQIYESNRAALKPLFHDAGAKVKLFPIVPDNPDATAAALEQAFAACDIVVTCGGVSVGEMDFVKPAFEKLGGELQFWKVAIRPGKPFVFGRRREKFLFGLPGNPVSAFVTFLLLVRPVMFRWQGARNVSMPSTHGILAEPLANRGDRRHFVRVKVDGAGKVFSAGQQASHALGSLAAADGLVDLPPQTALHPGDPIKVMRW